MTWRASAVGRLLNWALVAVILLVAILFNQSAVHWRGDVADSDLFAYHGWCVAQGARPYLDVWDNKPPGIWWANAAAITLLGPGARADVLVSATALLVTMGAVVAAARTAYRRSLTVPAALVSAVLLTHLLWECGGNRTETFVATCETLAILGYLCWLRSRHRRWLVLAGLAAGTAPLFKQPGVAAAAAIALHMVWLRWRAGPAGRGWRPWIVAGAACLVPLAIAATALLRQGALREAAFAVGGFNQAYFAVDDATWVHMGRALGVFMPALAPMSGVFALVALGLVSGAYTLLRQRRSATRPRSRAGVGLFLIWGIVVVYLACVGPGRRGYHLVSAVPALTLLVLYPLHLLAGRRGLRTCLTTRPSAVCVLVVWGWVMVLTGAASVAEASRCWRAKPHWYSLGRSQPNECEQQASEVRRLTRPEDEIYVWGWSPGTYRYACRQPASRFGTLEKLGQVGRFADFIRDGAVADIRCRPPRAFVVSLRDYAAMNSDPPDTFGAWLLAHYRWVSTVSGMHVLLWRTGLDNVSAAG